MNKNQKGFSAIEGLLIFAVVGLIGFVGWYIWHNEASKPANSTSIITKTPASTAQSYLKIPELGIKIPNDNLGDLTYSYSGGVAILSSKSLGDSFKSNGCLYMEPHVSGIDGYVVQVFKGNNPFKPQANLPDTLYKQFDTYNINGWSLITACQDPNNSSAEPKGNTYTAKALDLLNKTENALKKSEAL